MSTSINYDKQVYKKSDMGKLESFIRRFYNIKELNNAFQKSPEGITVRKIRTDAEEWHIKHTDAFIEVENEFRIKQKAFMDEQNEYLLKQMNSEVNILRQFEKDFNSKVPQAIK